MKINDIHMSNKGEVRNKEIISHSSLTEYRRCLYQMAAEMAATMVAMKMTQPRIANTVATAIVLPLSMPYRTGFWIPISGDSSISLVAEKFP